MSDTPRPRNVSTTSAVCTPSATSWAPKREASESSASMTARRFGSVSQRSTKRSEEHTSELQSHLNLVCRLLLEKKKNKQVKDTIYCGNYEAARDDKWRRPEVR